MAGVNVCCFGKGGIGLDFFIPLLQFGSMESGHSELNAILSSLFWFDFNGNLSQSHFSMELCLGSVDGIRWIRRTDAHIKRQTNVFNAEPSRRGDTSSATCSDIYFLEHELAALSLPAVIHGF